MDNLNSVSIQGTMANYPYLDSEPILGDEESRKNHALNGLAWLVTKISGEDITLKRDNETAMLLLNGDVLEEFSIGRDSPRSILFDAMKVILRYAEKIL
jgi:hypothetical protein